jgi:hypothetical protein
MAGQDGPKIDDLRAALDWAFSPAGNRSLGIALTVAAVPLWMQLSPLQECRSRVERALSALDASAAGDETSGRASYKATNEILSNPPRAEAIRQELTELEK